MITALTPEQAVALEAHYDEWLASFAEDARPVVD